MKHFVLRRDYHKNWEKNNPILRQGEMIFVIDKNALKIGIEKRYNDTEFINGEVYIKNSFYIPDLGEIKADLASDLSEFLEIIKNESINRNFSRRYSEIQNIFSVYNFNPLKIEEIENDKNVIKLIETEAEKESSKKINFKFRVIDNKIINCVFKELKKI